LHTCYQIFFVTVATGSEQGEKPIILIRQVSHWCL